MGKRNSVYDLPIFHENRQVFLELLQKLDALLQQEDTRHKELIRKTYENGIQVFPLLNAGYNYWSLKGKLQIYNKVRSLLSMLEIQTYFLYELSLLEKSYGDEFDAGIKYLNGLIRKLESHPQEHEQQ